MGESGEMGKRKQKEIVNNARNIRESVLMNENFNVIVE